MSALLLGLLLAGPARGEWRSFGVTEGLASRTVRAILKDRSGRLWFGGDHGLSISDGANWNQDLTGWNVLGLAEDHVGAVWVASDSGIARWDGGRWTRFDTGSGLASNTVRALAVDRAGAIWAATPLGAMRWDGARWSVIGRAGGLASDNVLSLLVDHLGRVWCGTFDGGVSVFENGAWRTYTVADGLADDGVWCMAEDSTGGMWFGSVGRGVSRLSGGQWSRFTTSDGLGDAAVFAIFATSRRDVWFGTQGGVTQFDGERWRTFTSTDGLSSDPTYAVLEDGVGNLWFGTSNGASRFDQSGWAKLRPGLGINTCYVDPQGSLWFGSVAGAIRFDGRQWTTLTTADGLPDDNVQAVLRDRGGDLWFGTARGVMRSGPSGNRIYTAANGLSSDYVLCIAQDLSGNMWFGNYLGGISRLDINGQWTTFPVAYDVRVIHQDRDGVMWFGSYGGGVYRFDGSSWERLPISSGVISILEDRQRRLWFGTWGGGVSRRDPSGFVSYTRADGLAGDVVNGMVEDSLGIVWFATDAGLSRWDGTTWRSFTTADGLVDNTLWGIVADPHGSLWLASNSGIGRHDPDRVPAHAVIARRPPEVSASRLQTIPFAAAFGEAHGTEFSYSLDGAPWSGWSSSPSWLRGDLSDGVYTFRLRARDWLEQVEPSFASCTFEIDATPATPVIAAPRFNEIVRDTLVVRGSVEDARFAEYQVELRPAGATSWDPSVARLLASSRTIPAGGALATLDTRTLSDGEHEIRVSVGDTLGLVGRAVTRAIVDNQFPPAAQTSPVRVSAGSGGDAYNTDGSVHLYFPPHAFSNDALVSVVPVAAAELPASLPGGEVPVQDGVDISWAGATLDKPASLTVAVSPATASSVGTAAVSVGSASGVFAIHERLADGSWARIGGTYDAAARLLRAPISEPGRLAIFLENGLGSGPRTLSSLLLTPRVFAPRGSFAAPQVAIGFVLGRSGPVTVKIYSRSGRRVRELMSGIAMGQGANEVRWDGRGDDGSIVEDGLYIVSVSALGQTQTRPLAVVR